MNATAKSGVWLLAAVALVGCRGLGLGVRPAERPEVPPDAPVILYEAARDLRGRALDELVRRASPPAEPQPMDAQLLRRVAERAAPAVVGIYARTQVPYRIKLLPLPTSGLQFEVEGEALGSGFFISPEGYLLTNSHVLENATAAVARTQDGVDHELVLVAEDPVFDLALLRVARADREFPVIPIGASGEARIGDWVIAVGNPLGLGHTVTHGIVSQTGRQIVPLAEGAPGRAVRYLQTDTPINPGSSGGPLITLDGHFIAVTTAVLGGTQGISFCVPSEQVEEFLERVLAGEGVQAAPPPAGP